MAPACQISKRTCEILHNVAMVFGEVSMTNNVAQHFDVAVIGGVNADLIAEETRRAVDAARAHRPERDPAGSAQRAG
jgi:hypothetical protein